MLGGDADAEREPVEAGPSMDVEAVPPPREETVVGPARRGQGRPVEAQGDQADLSAVGVSREDEVDVVLRERVEAHRIVEQEQA